METWFFCRTTVHCLRAASPERTAGRYVQWAWCLSFDLFDRFGEIHTNIKNRTDQRSCIRMHCMFCQIFCRKHFHDISKIHHRYFVRTGLDQRNIMTDKSNGNIFFFLEFHDQFNNRLLYRHIQCRSCLIQNQNLRFQSQCTGNGYTLTMTTGHVMGITVCKLSRKLHHLQKPAAGCIHLALLDTVKVQKRLAYDITDLHFRVERRGRVLEHHLNMLTVLTQLLTFQFCNIFSTIQDLSLGRSIQRHQETHECRFTTAGFTYQSQCLSFIEFQVNIIVGNQSTSA